MIFLKIKFYTLIFNNFSVHFLSKAIFLRNSPGLWPWGVFRSVKSSFKSYSLAALNLPFRWPRCKSTVSTIADEDEDPAAPMFHVYYKRTMNYWSFNNIFGNYWLKLEENYNDNFDRSECMHFYLQVFLIH